MPRPQGCLLLTAGALPTVWGRHASQAGLLLPLSQSFQARPTTTVCFTFRRRLSGPLPNTRRQPRGASCPTTPWEEERRSSSWNTGCWSLNDRVMHMKREAFCKHRLYEARAGNSPLHRCLGREMVAGTSQSVKELRFKATQLRFELDWMHLGGAVSETGKAAASLSLGHCRHVCGGGPEALLLRIRLTVKREVAVMGQTHLHKEASRESSRKHRVALDKLPSGPWSAL